MLWLDWPGFKQISQSVLNDPGGIMTIVPPQVTKGNIEFLFNVAAFLNDIFKRRGSNTLVLTHYWPPSYHNPWLKHLSLDLNCGDVRKYGDRRLTKVQKASNFLHGRCHRALTLVPSQLESTSLESSAALLFQ